MIEYTATMFEEGGPHDRVSDLNYFWMAIDPKAPEGIFALSLAQAIGNFHMRGVGCQRTAYVNDLTTQ